MHPPGKEIEVVYGMKEAATMNAGRNGNGLDSRGGVRLWVRRTIDGWGGGMQEAAAACVLACSYHDRDV